MDQEKRELRHQLKNAEQEKLALKGLVNRAADELDDHVRAKFDELDADGSGGLDSEEVAELVKELTGGKGLPKGQLKKAMKKLFAD